MSLSTRKFLVLALVVLVGGSLAGGLVGKHVQADTERPEDQLWTFGRVLALVEDQHVGDVDSKEMIERAIDGMLGALDPHSNYLPPEAFSEMRDEQRGRFHGLGIQITKRGPDKPLTIIAPIDGTPASRAGLQSGDMISQIEEEPTIEMTVQDAVRLLKGDKGTRVTITIQRPSLSEPFDVTIERDEIPIQSVRVSYMVGSDVGVVRIANFNTTTADELDDAVEQLRSQGMEKLILDLRGNPGGLLDQAVQVSERFVKAGDRIVYTRGRIVGSSQDFVAKDAAARIDVPLVVLVDESSASASEIVSGAVQDHDRGLVIGEATFGKGLVQRVIPLQDGGALAVTTAKYYTPSGRLIQRDYSDLDDYYLAHRGDVEGGSLPIEDSEREVFHTDAGREVYGGGGITPDYVVRSQRAPEILSRLRRENLIFDFSVDYIARQPEIKPDVPVDDQLLAAFASFVRDRDVELSAEEAVEHRDVISLRLRAQIARIRWGMVEEARIIAQADPQIQRAIEAFQEATQLHDRANLRVSPRDEEIELRSAEPTR